MGWESLLGYMFSSLFTQNNPLSANITKWPNTLKQFVGKLPTNCLRVFDHFVGLALKGLIQSGNKSEIKFDQHPSTKGNRNKKRSFGLTLRLFKTLRLTLENSFSN